MNIFKLIFFAGTRDPRKQLCVARRTAMLIQALKYPHTFEYVVLQRLAVKLASRFTKAVSKVKSLLQAPVSMSEHPSSFMPLQLTAGLSWIQPICQYILIRHVCNRRVPRRMKWHD
jgi:hypothetical protein